MTGTSLDYAWADYNTLLKISPTIAGKLVEVRYMLNEEISKSSPDEIKPDFSSLYCYYYDMGLSHIYIANRDFTTGETETDYYESESPWIGDKQLGIDEMKKIKIPVEQAVKLALNDPDAKASDGLDTKYVTLRWPLWPVWENPQYVFGGSAGRVYHVFVDAVTGKVSTLDDIDPSESAEGSVLVLIDDHNKMCDLYGNGEEPKLGFQLTIQDHLVEVRYKLEYPLDDNAKILPCALNVEYSFYVPAGESGDGKSYVVKGKRDFTSRKDLETSESAGATWSGDKYFTPDQIDNLITLNDAMNFLMNSDTDIPHTDEVILHWPDAGSQNPQYEFKYPGGSSSVYLDGLTGEVVKK